MKDHRGPSLGRSPSTQDDILGKKAIAGIFAGCTQPVKIPLRQREDLCFGCYFFYLAGAVVGSDVFVEDSDELGHDVIALERDHEAAINVHRSFGLLEGA